MHKIPINKGSSLVQYAIIIALIALALVPVFYMFGHNIISSFNELHQGLSGQEAPLSKNPGPVNTATQSSLKGTSENPVKNCVDGVCSIDFGNYILTGIPENFDMFIQTQGTSGGTDKIAELIEQLANQLTNDGKIEEGKEIMRLATLGHNLALLQNYAESIVVDCNKNKACIKAEFNSPMTEPDGYNDSVSPFLNNVTYQELSESLFDIGRARYEITSKNEAYESSLSNNRLAYVIVDQFDTIINNPSIDDSVKGVIKELYWDIGTVSEDFDNNLGFLYINNSGPAEHFDPLTGKLTHVSSGSDPFTDFENYSASKITHFDSSLICASGKGTDTGVECH